MVSTSSQPSGGDADASGATSGGATTVGATTSTATVGGTRDPAGASASQLPVPGQRVRLAWWQKLVCFVVLAGTIFPLWYSLGDHPLYPHSEGRYAAVSRDMLVHDHWLVPRYRGRRHLTKPLLAYWAQAGAMAVMGINEWASRAPSALAGTMVLLMLFALGWYLRDLRLAALSAGVLGMMPMFVVVSRLTLTDSLLNMFWFAAMAAGYLAIAEPPGRRRNWFVVILWVAVAGGWMTKGPLALVPVGVLVIWLLLAGNWRQIRVLRPIRGLVLSMIPIAAWVALVAVRDPAAWHIWYVQMVSRAVGTGDHPEPFWYFLPIFIGGLFPATAMMYLPGANFPWRRIWPELRSGKPAVYWTLSIVLPFIMFSLIKGKLATYILPLCAPLALLTGQMLLGWIERKHDHPPKGIKPPEVVATFFICLAIAMAVIMGLLIYQYGAGFPLAPVFMAGVLAASAWMWRIWQRKPTWRAAALLIVFLAYAVNVSAAMELEDAILTPGSSKVLMQVIKKQLHLPHPEIVTYGYRDTTMGFYYDDWNESETPAELRHWLNKADPDLVIVAETKDWKKLEVTHPALAGRFTRMFKWNRSPITKNRWVLRPDQYVKAGPAAKAGVKAPAVKAPTKVRAKP